MIRKYGIRTYDDAKEEATALLWEFRKTSERMRTTNHTKRNRDGEFNGFSYIKDDDTGAIACIYSLTKKENSYTVVFLTEEESKKENIIYPFRDVTDSMLPFLLAANARIVKPTKAIYIGGAFTPDAQAEVELFFGDYKPEERKGGYTIDNTFWCDEEGKPISFECPDDSIVEKAIGTKIKTSADYIKAISKLLEAELTDQQKELVREAYELSRSCTLLDFAIYELFRTEDYYHMKEILSKYKYFGLPENWEKGYTIIENGFTAEEFIIGCYLNSSSKIIMEILNSGKQLKDIAEYTNTPYRTILRASRNKYIMR